MSTYKERAGEIANAYWQARWAHDEIGARLQWNRMSTVEPDALPDWVHPDAAAFARRLAMNDVTEHLCEVIARGAWPGDMYHLDPGPDWQEMPEATNGFRAVWSYLPWRAVLTYCEGDTSLQITGGSTNDDALYFGRLAEARRYYRRA